MISVKLAEIQATLKAPKNRYNKFGEFKYRSCEDILEAVKPILKDKGCLLTLSDKIEHIGERYYIVATAEVFDLEDGGSITATAYAREQIQKTKMDEAQVTGSASSYARKYALNGLFLLDDTKDADTDENYRQQNPEQAAKLEKLLHSAAEKGIEKDALLKRMKVKDVRDLTVSMIDSLQVSVDNSTGVV